MGFETGFLCFGFGGGWEGGLGSGLGRGWGRVREGLWRAWLSILQKPSLKKPLTLLRKSQGISAMRNKFGHFHHKTHPNRNRIVTAKKSRLLESGQACGHHLQSFNVGWPCN